MSKSIHIRTCLLVVATYVSLLTITGSLSAHATNPPHTHVTSEHHFLEYTGLYALIFAALAIVYGIYRGAMNNKSKSSHHK
ncbi:hypothetical protein [Poriferisphaera sp. WC338]|uniref:hypothetical protein n=1 Tax=Poriferisphaera sp. WC338 TaxID=3425129 RepID=UPI003D81BB2E